MRRRTQARSVTTESLRGAGGPGGAAGVRQFPGRCEATHKGPEGAEGEGGPHKVGREQSSPPAGDLSHVPAEPSPASHVRAVTGAVR